MSETQKPVRQLTTKEAAARTGYSVAWFQRQRWLGSGPPYRKIGRTVRYPEDLLIQWIEQHGLHKKMRPGGYGVPAVGYGHGSD